MKTQKDFRGISDSVSGRVMAALRKAVSRKRSGFTLAELIVVVTILAILATVGFLALSGYSRDAGESAAKANVRSVLTAVRSESAITGNSPRRYVVHDSSLSWVALSWAFVEFDGDRTYLTWGAWNAAWTNYSAGSPDWAVLKIDPSKFRTSASGLFHEASAAYDPKSVVLASVEATYPPSVTGRSRARTFTQAAAFLPSGTAYVTGDVPAFSTASGASLWLVRDPGSPSLTGAVTDSSSVGVPANQGILQSSPYSLANSLRFDSVRTSHLSRTPTVAGNRKTWTWSGWVKRNALANGTIVDAGSIAGDYYTRIDFNANKQLYLLVGIPGSNPHLATSNAVFRDTSAWYHIVWKTDTTQSDPNLRFRLFVNGNEVTMNRTATVPQNFDTTFNSTGYKNTISASARTDSYAIYGDAYFSDVNFVDGQALDPAVFGEPDPTSWSWRPKQYSGTYGTGGYRLDFSSWSTAAGLGLDSAPIEGTWHVAKNHWTPSGIAVTDQMADNPTNNFATLNPLQTGGYSTLTSWNLKSTGNTATNSAIAASTVSSSVGKWYWEATQWTVSTEMVGVATKPITNPSSLLNAEVFPWTNGIGARYNGYVNGISGETQSVTAFSWTNGDVIGVAIDADNGAIYFSKNGTWLNGGIPDSGTAKTGAFSKYSPDVARTVTPTLGSYNGGTATANFGQWGSAWLQYCTGAGWWFKTCPPAGFKAFSTANLPTPAIANPKTAFDALTYVGTSSNNTVSGLAFQPDFMWFKNRDTSAVHSLIDGVRWWNRSLSSNGASSEAPEANPIAFPTVGSFTIPSSYGGSWNDSGNKYAAWCWKGGGNAVANTEWTIASQVSANPAAGFSTVTYTGNTSQIQTVGHGLGTAPKLVIIKSRTPSGTWNWNVWFNGFTSDEYLLLNSTSGKGSYVGNFWSVPNANVFGVDSRVPAVNAASVNFVAYAWSEVPGFSKFGSYVGNNSTDGPFVHTGFTPKFIMIKRTDAASDWFIVDGGRSPYNPSSLTLGANQTFAENSYAATSYVDRLSNGFKIRQDITYGYENAPGGTYVYAAFAEAPFWWAGMAPGTAR